MNNSYTHKHNYLMLSLLALCLFTLSLSQPVYADDDNTSSPVSQVKVFHLNVWAPDEVAPADAKLAEYGGNYQYQYTPESHELDTSNGEQLVAFKLHHDAKQRYQFRWISTDHPQLVSFTKVKAKKIKVQLDETEEDTDVYFELWLVDTHTGAVLMCDPRIVIRK